MHCSLKTFCVIYYKNIIIVLNFTGLIYAVAAAVTVS